MATKVAGWAMLYISGAETAPCSSDPVAVNVNSTSGVQGLINEINCTGEGFFDVTWYGTVQIEQTIVVSDQKSVTITGSNSPTASTGESDPDEPVATIDGGNTTRLFDVSDGSILTLNILVLNGGYSEGDGGGVTVSSGSLNVFGCAFANNQALSNGGEVTIRRSKARSLGDNHTIIPVTPRHAPSTESRRFVE